MKKYSVIDLYVIEKKHHKFICEYFFGDEYIEVLTKEKIKVDNKEKVERLIEYYSIHVRLCLNSKQTLMLTKKDVFLKYLEINEKTINKELDTPYEVIPLDKNVTEEQMKDIMIDMWQTYVEGKKDSVPDIQIMSAKELIKQKNKP